MRKVYFLSTCSTSKRIINELDLRSKDFEFQDIKSESITENQLSEMHKLAGSYEALFSRIARKYKEFDLKNKSLTEEDYKAFILNEYTFLKRPVVIIDQQIFIGSSKANIQNLGNAVN
ncbi:MAG: arsenate reductase [Bacteroidetes bacterium]|nr:MAG: arsenate reductase [Bacteroidota bacterium]